MTCTTIPDSRLPTTREVPPPARTSPHRHQAAGASKVLVGTDASPDAFTSWSHRQYQQLLAPIGRILSTSAHVALAERTNLSRNAVRSALDGSTWPQLQTVLRLAHVAGVECFTMGARNLVRHGPPLPAVEQALLAAYRRLSAQEQKTLLQAAIDTASLRAA